MRNCCTKTCRFKIDKITFSKRSLEQRMTIDKISLYCNINKFCLQRYKPSFKILMAEQNSELYRSCSSI